MVDLYSFNDKDETQTVDYIVNDICKKYPPQKMLVELNSIGNIFYGLLEKKIREQKIRTDLQGFVTTNDSKASLVNELQLAFQNRSIQILKNDELINQLSMFTAKVSVNSNKVSYSASGSYHDDDVISLMLALKSCQIVKYCIR
jgi:PBP1b-binding outer membrane lipoprotein LpoB